MRDILDEYGSAALSPEERAKGLAALHDFVDQRIARTEWEEVGDFNLEEVLREAHVKRDRDE